ncbi:unnamed protein product [Sphenostylis stenocarpa]|uniref:pectinesterase n=1 Tax=Sphenostylis stenocarpa TaxID=92480 RepID=A0AA86T806_9FABA|nr:unnamed protein product [Sphenostylis stenocarpa]
MVICVVTGNRGTSYAYLGRPWRPFARVVFAFTFMDQCIKHAGWNNWGKVFWTGFRPSQRVKWAGELKNEGVEQFRVTPSLIQNQTDLGFLKE